MKLEFSGQIFWQLLKYQIWWKSFQWEPSFSLRIDIPDEANDRFRNSANCGYGKLFGMGVKFDSSHWGRKEVWGFYIHGSMHRDPILKISKEMQQYAGVYWLQNYSTCFGCLSHPSSGVHKTVTAASGTNLIKCQSKNLPPACPN